MVINPLSLTAAVSLSRLAWCDGEKKEKQSFCDSEFPHSECGWSRPCGVHVFSCPTSYNPEVQPTGFIRLRVSSSSHELGLDFRPWNLH